MDTSSNPEPVQPPQPSEHRARRGNNLVWAVALIVIGGIMLVRNLLGVQGVFNWWAIFILIPAAGAFSTTVAVVQRSGRFNAAARSSLGSGIVLTTLAVMFLFNLDWGKWWPLMVIALGVSLILGGITDSSLHPLGAAGGFLNLGAWIGLAAVLLGFGFLFQNLQVFDPAAWLPQGWRWWGLMILLPGIGALLNGFLLRKGQTTLRKFSSAGLVLIGLLACVIGGLAFFGLNWRLLTPLALIAAGLGFLFSLMGQKPAE